MARPQFQTVDFTQAGTDGVVLTVAAGRLVRIMGLVVQADGAGTWSLESQASGGAIMLGPFTNTSAVPLVLPLLPLDGSCGYYAETATSGDDITLAFTGAAVTLAGQLYYLDMDA